MRVIDWIIIAMIGVTLIIGAYSSRVYDSQIETLRKELTKLSREYTRHLQLHHSTTSNTDIREVSDERNLP